MRLSCLFAVTTTLGALFVSSTALADDDDIGTRPAMSKKAADAPPPPASPSASTPASQGSSGSGAYERTEEVDSDAGGYYRGNRAPLATDPPGDWYVLHAGLRPQLGTFGGIATFALAHARTERFYGAFSLSAVRNDAGTH